MPVSYRGPRAPHQVAVLALDSVVPFDLGVACQIFGYWHPDRGVIRYRMTLCAPTPGLVRTAVGFPIAVAAGLEALRTAATVVVPGIADLDAEVPTHVRTALCAAHARGARIAAICTGAFVLADAGLLDGRDATTHWRDAARLAARHPAVRVNPRVLYVDAGTVLTSAGIAAGIDLCLHMVRCDYGEDVASAVARRLVVAPHRDGGQAQFIEHAVPAVGHGLELTRAWMLEHLATALTVDTMAAHAAVSRRTFARRFRAETGTTPVQWLLAQRVLHARRLLETTREPVAKIATHCGFGSAPAFRAHFARSTGTSPMAYRRAFHPRDFVPATGAVRPRSLSTSNGGR